MCVVTAMQTSNNAATLHLIAPIGFLQNSITFFGSVTLYTMKMTILEDNLTNLNDPKHEEDPNIEDIPINENNEKSEDT